MNISLLDDLGSLPAIDEEQARVYHENIGTLVEQVNKIMANRNDLNGLIGKNTLSLMFENHKNHAQFMSNVFFFNNYYFLANIVPWVYRVYSNQGFSYEYFPAHLQAWEKALKDQLPDHVAGPMIKVYDWLIDNHEHFISLAKETSFLSIEVDPGWEDIYQGFLQAVLKGDRKASLEISHKYVASYDDLKKFYVNVIQPTMYKVGEMWERGDISVANEHLASALVNRVMSMQYLQVMEQVEINKSKVLVTAAVNEFHEIGGQMVANSLEADGWDVDYLGANTPSQDLLDLVWKTQPFILAVSIAMPFNLLHVQQIIRKIQEWPEERKPKIMLGGLAFSNFPDMPRMMGADDYARDCLQAVALARKWWQRDML